jgi:hypothetical protein
LFFSGVRQPADRSTPLLNLILGALEIAFSLFKSQVIIEKLKQNFNVKRSTSPALSSERAGHLTGFV